MTDIDATVDAVTRLEEVHSFMAQIELQLLHRFRGWPTSERREQLLAMPYVDYLRTPEWRRTRLLALAAAGYVCQCCPRSRTDGAVLHVHHREYDSRGAEFLSDLVVLCDDCHARIHGKRQ